MDLFASTWQHPFPHETMLRRIFLKISVNMPQSLASFRVQNCFLSIKFAFRFAGGTRDWQRMLYKRNIKPFKNQSLMKASEQAKGKGPTPFGFVDPVFVWTCEMKSQCYLQLRKHLFMCSDHQPSYSFPNNFSSDIFSIRNTDFSQFCFPGNNLSVTQQMMVSPWITWI